MNDLINRQAALDEILSLLRNQSIITDVIYNMVVHQAYDKIEALPSVNTDWIPVSERLPENLKKTY